MRAAVWDNDFPGLIPPSPVVYEPMPTEGLTLEGQQLVALEVGHTDTDDTTVLHVPSIGLVVAGDAVYNGVHQMLLESPGGGLEAWLTALHVIEALEPKFVVAGHKNRELPDDPATIDETRQYLLDAQKLIAAKVTPQQYFDDPRLPVSRPPEHRSGLVLRTRTARMSDAGESRCPRPVEAGERARDRPPET